MFGSPSQTKGILRCGDTGKIIDSKWATQIRPAAVSGSDDSLLSAKFVPKTENNVRLRAKLLRMKTISAVVAPLWLADSGKQTDLVNNLETWAKLSYAGDVNSETGRRHRLTFVWSQTGPEWLSAVMANIGSSSCGVGL